jgi:hypothetical protein
MGSSWAALTPLLFVLLAIMALGVVLVRLGWRGRAVNDHPICRRCRFDLVGLEPLPPRCPECGQELHRARAVEIGARRRRRGLLCAGIVVLLLVLGGVVGGGVLLSGRVNIYAHLPEAALLRIAKAAVPQSTRAIDEMTSRLVAGTLSQATIEKAAEHALERQGDPQGVWISAWGEFLAAAGGAGNLTEAMLDRFVNQAITLTPIIPEKLKKGHSASFGLEITMDRAGRRMFAAAHAPGPSVVRIDDSSTPAPLWESGNRRSRLGSGGQMRYSASRDYYVSTSAPTVRLRIEGEVHVELTGVITRTLTRSFKIEREFEVEP